MKLLPPHYDQRIMQDLKIDVRYKIDIDISMLEWHNFTSICCVQSWYLGNDQNPAFSCFRAMTIYLDVFFPRPIIAHTSHLYIEQRMEIYNDNESNQPQPQTSVTWSIQILLVPVLWTILLLTNIIGSGCVWVK